MLVQADPKQESLYLINYSPDYIIFRNKMSFSAQPKIDIGFQPPKFIDSDFPIACSLLIMRVGFGGVWF